MRDIEGKEKPIFLKLDVSLGYRESHEVLADDLELIAAAIRQGDLSQIPSSVSFSPGACSVSLTTEIE